MPTIAIAVAVARRFLVLRHLLAPPRSLPADHRQDELVDWAQGWYTSSSIDGQTLSPYNVGGRRLARTSSPSRTPRAS